MVESLVPLEGPDTQDSKTDPGPDHLPAAAFVVVVNNNNGFYL